MTIDAHARRKELRAMTPEQRAENRARIAREREEVRQRKAAEDAARRATPTYHAPAKPKRKLLPSQRPLWSPLDDR